MLPLEVLAALEGPAVHELLEDALLAPRDGVVVDLVVVALQDGHAVRPAAKRTMNWLVSDGNELSDKTVSAESDPRNNSART